MLKKIAIVGANSYIARNLYKNLTEQSAKKSDNSYSFDVVLYDRESKHKDGSKSYVQANICNKSDLEKFSFDCDIIYMFVGKTGSINGFDEYDTFIDANEKSLLNVLSILRKENSKAKIVYPSTRLVYKGKNGVLTEESEKEFKTIYAMNKWACETYLKQYHDLYGINYLIFRICLPYGTLIEGASSYGTADFMLKKASAGEDITLYGDGAQRRTVTYIGDLVDVLIKGALSERCVNDVYNIGGENYSLKEMASLVAKRYGVKVNFVDWPQAASIIESGSTVFNSEKLEKEIGKCSKSRFEEWIKEGNAK